MKFLKFKFIYTAFIMLTLAFVSCEEDVATGSSLKDYVGMEPSKYVGIPQNGTVTVDSKVYATNVSDVDRTFALVVDPTSTHNASYYTVPATVTIPAGEKVGVFQVEIIGTNLGSGKTLKVGLEQLPGVNQAVTGYTAVLPPGSALGAYPDVTVVRTNQIVYTIEETCDFNKVILSITFDNYPEETAWELRDSAMDLVASGGFNAAGDAITGYAALGFADRSTFTTNFCLPGGQYTFAIYDDYGDGMYTSASVSGNYSVKLGDTVLASGSGDFGFFQETTFTLP
ncbi:hypothetical protein [Flavobacterium sp.]|uniref:hypothetical protein n=1 Tax=Flavobacterium sp. TaxID=239 RepID=UPI00286CBFD5|nr:hypothetical protein [Flavobacterium sp.]